MGNELDRIIEHRLQTLETGAAALTKCTNEMDRRLTILEVGVQGMKENTRELVTRQEFTPIRMIVYGLAATALTGLLSAILSKLFATG